MGFIFKSEKEKQEELEIKEYLDEYEKIEEDVEKEDGRKINILELFKKDPLEEDLKEYMTEDQINEENHAKKVNKTLITIGAIFISIVMVAALTLILFVNYNKQDELHKTVIKEFRTYYNDKYGTRTSIEDIDYLCYTNAERQKECTDIIYAHTKDGNVVMRKGEMYGDNNGISSVYKDYKEEISSIVGKENFIYDNPLISYKDFYYAYYQYIDYINVLPNNKSYKELKESKLITVRDFITYQGDIDVNSITQLLSNFTQDSEIVLLKTNKGMPVNLKVVHTYGYNDINIISENRIDDGITNYPLDSNYNNTLSIKVTKVATTSITPLKEGSTFNNTITITPEITRPSSNDEINREGLPSYYLIALDGIGENIIQFNKDKELNKESYMYMQTLNISNKTYILGNSNLSIGTINYSK